MSIIQQNHAEGIGKLVFYCEQGRLDLLGGILTTNDNAQAHFNTLEKSYFELDDRKNILLSYKKEDTSVDGETLWVNRYLDRRSTDKILNSSVMNVWTENKSILRWGIEVDIYPVKKKMEEYINSCNIRPKTPIDSDESLSYF